MLINEEFGEQDVTPVGPGENGGDEEGIVPVAISIAIFYYQQGLDEKEIIVIEMEFDELLELNEEELYGEEKIDYTLTVSFMSYSHRDLTI